jgi:hypothetical protein
MKKFIIGLIIFVSITAAVYFYIIDKVAQEKSYNESESEIITLTGRISQTPWQHMINIPSSHPFADYMDFDDDQMVVYSKEPIDCPGEVRVEGKYIEIEGTSKRPGSEEVYTELQILVDEFECVN